MPAARRFTATRVLTIAMTPKASAAAERNTKALTTSVLSPPETLIRKSNTASMSDPEVAHLVHHDVAGEHPCAGEAEAPFRDVELDDRAVEVGCHQVDQAEHRDRQAGQEDRREFSFR